MESDKSKLISILLRTHQTIPLIGCLVIFVDIPTGALRVA